MYFVPEDSSPSPSSDILPVPIINLVAAVPPLMVPPVLLRPTGLRLAFLDGRLAVENMTLLPLHRGCVFKLGLPEEVATKAKLPGTTVNVARTNATTRSRACEQGGDRIVIAAAVLVEQVALLPSTARYCGGLDLNVFS